MGEDKFKKDHTKEDIEFMFRNVRTWFKQVPVELIDDIAIDFITEIILGLDYDYCEGVTVLAGAIENLGEIMLTKTKEDENEDEEEA